MIRHTNTAVCLSRFQSANDTKRLSSQRAMHVTAGFMTESVGHFWVIFHSLILLPAFWLLSTLVLMHSLVDFWNVSWKADCSNFFSATFFSGKKNQIFNCVSRWQIKKIVLFSRLDWMGLCPNAVCIGSRFVKYTEIANNSI